MFGKALFSRYLVSLYLSIVNGAVKNAEKKQILHRKSLPESTGV